MTRADNQTLIFASATWSTRNGSPPLDRDRIRRRPTSTEIDGHTGRLYGFLVALDPEATRAYAERWRILSATARSELRAMSMQDKLRRLAALMPAASRFDRRHRDAEDAVARRRWARLQRLHRARS